MFLHDVRPFLINYKNQGRPIHVQLRYGQIMQIKGGVFCTYLYQHCAAITANYLSNQE